MCSLMCSAALVGFSSANKKISCFLSLSFQPLTFHGCFLFFSVSRWFLRICVAGVHSGHTERCIFTCFIPFWHYKYLFLSGFLSLQQLLFCLFHKWSFQCSLQQRENELFPPNRGLWFVSLPSSKVSIFSFSVLWFLFS